MCKYIYAYLCSLHETVCDARSGTTHHWTCSDCVATAVGTKHVCTQWTPGDFCSISNEFVMIKEYLEQMSYIIHFQSCVMSTDHRTGLHTQHVSHDCRVMHITLQIMQIVFLITHIHDFTAVFRAHTETFKQKHLAEEISFTVKLKHRRQLYNRTPKRQSSALARGIAKSLGYRICDCPWWFVYGLTAQKRWFSLLHAF